MTGFTIPWHSEGGWRKRRPNDIRGAERVVGEAARTPLARFDHDTGRRRAMQATCFTWSLASRCLRNVRCTVTLAEGVAHVFVAVDHGNSECVGIHADKSANRFQALEPIRQGVRRHFGAIGKDVAAGLMLRHDHGPNYLSDDFQSEIAFLAIEASPSFVRQPEGNGVAERFIRTLKENLLWGAPLRDHRRAAPGAARFRRLLQYPLAGRPPWPQDTCSDQGRPATGHRSGRMNKAAACLTTVAQYTRIE